jgi:NTP pyrophosphatase (non-canonical NTP hydrolase)
VELRELQEQMRRLYLERDRSRGTDATFRWLVEEVGELAQAIRRRDPLQLEHESSDVLAWLASVANLLEVDLERAAARYGDGCPKCGQTPCACPLDR